MLNVSRVYFIPAVVVALIWLSHSASALLIGGQAVGFGANQVCPSEMQGSAPLSAYNVSNLVTLGDRVQTSLIPIPTIDEGSSQLSSNALDRATFQTSFWNEATGFHDLSSSPVFENMPSQVADQFFQAPVMGVPVWQPSLPPLFM